MLGVLELTLSEFEQSKTPGPKGPGVLSNL